MVANWKLGAAAARTLMVTAAYGSLAEIGSVTVPNAVGGEGIATS